MLLTDDLTAMGAPAITRDARREAFERLQIPPTATLTDATAIRIGQLVGASDVITGSLQLEGDTLVVHARGLALEAARISYDVIERGPVPELFSTFDRAAHRFVPASRVTDREDQPRTSLAAFSYVSGLRRNARQRYHLLERRVDGALTFDRARLAPGTRSRNRAITRGRSQPWRRCRLRPSGIPAMPSKTVAHLKGTTRLCT